MKLQINHRIFYLLLSIFVLHGCKKGFMDIDPTGEVPADATWKDGALAEAFTTGVYTSLNAGGFSEQMLASLTDEATFTHTGRNINVVMEGGASPSNQGWIPDYFNWGNLYNGIRAANLVLVKLKDPQIDTALANRLKGEAHFLRAYFYQNLVRYYGGVPLITRLYDLNEDYKIARNTYEECVNLIAADCDTATWLLSNKSMDKGRATSLAALSLKARMLTYAASDLYYLPLAKTRIPELSATSKPEIFGYTGGDRMARWRAAQAAAKAVIDLGTGYKLSLSLPVSAAEGKINYMSLAMAGYSKAAELDASANDIILGRYYNLNIDDGAGVDIARYNGPNGYHNWAGNTPIGLLADDYEMADGTPFNWDNPLHKAHPYTNRDPRFYATLLYDGANWKPRNLISGDVDPANQIQTGQYDLTVSGNRITFKGLDTRGSSIEDWNGSRSGYYMRKFIDPDPKIVAATTKQLIPWPFFRYTEAVFNYVEACIELGQETEARLWLNRIRFRSGMPAIIDAGDALKKRFRNEKRIEMAYEEQRYFDVRRWLIPETTVGRKLTFINIVGTFKTGQQLSGKYKYDETIYDYKYTPVTDDQHEKRTWINKMYYPPISRDEMNKNTLLIQNPGY